MTRSVTNWLVYPHSRPFRWLWWSQTISLFGNQVSFVAIPLLAALTMRAGPFEMGLLVAVETGAYLLVSVPAGIVTDRVGRWRLLVLTNLGRAVILLAIPFGAGLGGLSLPLLYAVTASVGALSAVFDVAYQSYVPELLAPGDLLDGNQRVELSESAARTLGPGFAGGLIATVGGAAAVTIDAVSYVVASVALVGAGRSGTGDERAGGGNQAEGTPVGHGSDSARRAADGHAPGTPALTPAPVAGGDAGLSAGFRIVLGDRVLRDTAISTGIFNLASSAILAVFVLFAARDLGLSATLIGIVVGLSNVGFVVGALTVSAVTKRLGMGSTLTISAVLGAIGTVLLPFASGPLAVVLLCAGRFVGALAIPWFNVNARSFRQSRAPIRAIGRVSSVFRLIDWGTLPVGALVGGWIGTTFGLQTTLAVGAVLGIASAAWFLASPIRQVRGLDIADDGQAPKAISARAAGPLAPATALRVGARLAAMGDLSLRWSALAIAGFALQLALFLPRVSLFGVATPMLYVGSCIAVLACVVRNLRVPGLAIVALGGFSNLLAIVFNGGFMPVAAAASRAAGQQPPSSYVTTIETANPALQPLTDIFVVSWPAPLANVYSIGDVLILVGVLVTAAWVLRRSSGDGRGDAAVASDGSEAAPSPPGATVQADT